MLPPHGRQLRQGGGASRVRAGERNQRLGFHVGQRGRGRREHHRHAAGQHIVDALRTALIGHMRQFTPAEQVTARQTRAMRASRAALGFICWTVLAGHAGVRADGILPMLAGLLLPIVGGVSITISLLWCRRLNDRGIGVGRDHGGALSAHHRDSAGGDDAARRRPATVGTSGDLLALAIAATVLIVLPLYSLRDVGSAPGATPTHAHVIRSLGPIDRSSARSRASQSTAASANAPHRKMADIALCSMCKMAAILRHRAGAAAPAGSRERETELSTDPRRVCAKYPVRNDRAAKGLQHDAHPGHSGSRRRQFWAPGAIARAAGGLRANGRRRQEVATFAGGCFWCTEADFDKVPGVISTTSGYHRRQGANPSYQQVTSGTTGHTEAVEIVFDPAKVTLPAIARRVLAQPRSARQGPPVLRPRRHVPAGHLLSQRSSSARWRRPRKSRRRASSRRAWCTPKSRAEPFYKAEDYHQDYHEKNPVRYKLYRFNCGRDQRLEELWGKSDKSS